MGRSGLRVSRLGLGTLTWGTATDEHDAADLLRVFRDAGGTLIETSPAYGDGAAESLLGKLFSSSLSRRDIVLSVRTHTSGSGSVRSRRELLAQLDTSLSRLGADIDLWHLAGWDSRVPLEETLAAADVAVSSGRVGYLGVSDCSGWQLARSLTQQEMLRRTPVVGAAAEWSLLARGVEGELVPACRELGVGVIAGSPLARGVLTGKYRTAIPSDSRAADAELGDSVEAYLRGRPRSVVDALITAADGLGVSALVVSMGWLLARPELTSAVLGARTPAQLRAGLAAGAATALPPAILSALDDVSAPSSS